MTAPAFAYAGNVPRSLVSGLLLVIATSCWAEKPPVTNSDTVLVDSPLDRAREMLPREITKCLEELPEDGAGEDFHGLTQLDFDDWSVFPKGPVIRGVEETDPPILQSDALLVLWSESVSALIYWTGRGFAWYQQGD